MVTWPLLLRVMILTGTGELFMRLEGLFLMKPSFNQPEVQDEGNQREYGDDLKTVEKFIQTCHRIACVIRLQTV
jgi:hypothetical protein